LRACEIAGVEPQFETYEGDDADGYAYATNRRRRNLRVGAGYIIDEEYLRHLGVTQENYTKLYNGSQPRLSEAAVILDHALNLREAVFIGQMSLQAAAELARERKKQDAENAANMARFKEVASDLHALVDINNMLRGCEPEI
jgi:plasmid maintenance system antidote protein VapI